RGLGSRARREVASGAGRGGCGPSHLARLRAHRVAQDVRLARDARPRADRTPLDVRRSAPRSVGAGARRGAPRARARDEQVVEGRAPRRVCGLQPERQGPYGGVCLLGAADARCAGLGAAQLGRSGERRPGRFYTRHHAQALRQAGRSARGDRPDGRIARRLARAIGPARAGGPGRRALAAALQEATRRAPARAAVPGPRCQVPADRDRAGQAQTGRARGAQTLEGPSPQNGQIPRARRRAGRCDARPLVYLDPDPPEPAARAAQAPAPSGTPRPGREDLGELVGTRHLELVVATGGGALVRPPAQEGRGVAEAVALQVVVFHLAHALDAQRLPGEILAGAPATLRARHAGAPRVGLGPCSPGVLVQGVLAQGRELFHELLAHRYGEGRGHADVLQRAAVIVQAEQQRADRVLARLVPAKSRHHAVGGAGVLDLDHGALAGLVGECRRLGDDAIQARALELV